MNRVTAVAATLAAAATATMAAATIVPAMAAPRPATAGPAHAKTADVKTTGGQRAKAPSYPPTSIASEMDGGKYVTVVHCKGEDSPPPINLSGPGTPLTVSGTGPSAAIFKMLKQQDPYKTIYTCTVTVEEKVPAPKAALPKRVAAHKACEIGTGKPGSCTKKVTLNTGFGGLARQVKNHRPAG
jgi:hypothetical protein